MYNECVRPQIPVIAKAQAAGIRVWQPRIKAAEEAMHSRVAQARARAQAAVGWPINLGSNPQLAAQLYDVEGLPAPRKRRP